MSTSRTASPVIWAPLSLEKIDWVYSSNELVDAQRRCIGHLRGDFGRDGDEFWTSWFDHIPSLKTDAFVRELQSVVNTLRKKGCLLDSYRAMIRNISSGTPLSPDSYGFEGVSDSFTYCLRCIQCRGDYNFYLYAYCRA